MDVTTNGNESLNGDLITVFPKRMFSVDGSRHDNHSMLAALRRVHGRRADELILEALGFELTPSIKKAMDRVVQQRALNRQLSLSRMERRKEIPHIRSGWDKKVTADDEKKGRTHKPRKKRSKEKATTKRTNTATNYTRSTPCDDVEAHSEEENDEEVEDDCSSDGSDGYIDGDFGPAMSDEAIHRFLQSQASERMAADAAARAARLAKRNK